MRLFVVICAFVFFVVALLGFGR